MRGRSDWRLISTALKLLPPGHACTICLMHNSLLKPNAIYIYYCCYVNCDLLVRQFYCSDESIYILIENNDLEISISTHKENQINSILFLWQSFVTLVMSKDVEGIFWFFFRTKRHFFFAPFNKKPSCNVGFCSLASITSAVGDSIEAGIAAGAIGDVG